MKRPASFSVLIATSLGIAFSLQGCQGLHEFGDFVSTPFRTRPKPGTTTTTTTTTTTVTKRTTTAPHSDVKKPGHAVATASPAPKKKKSGGTKPVPTPSPSSAPKVAKAKKVEPKRTAEATGSGAASAKESLPTAKRVADKPGYVVSPFDSRKRPVDVRGYASGSRIKDPWTGKMFLVP